MAKLVILQDDIEARTVSLDADTIQIGSAEGNAIRIRSPEVSREHCEIRRSGMQYRLVDLESKTGTQVNGEFVNQHLLEDGDEVELGGLVLRFQREGADGVRVASRRARRRPRPRARPAPPHRPSAAPAVFVSVGVGILLVVVAVLALRRGGGEPSVNEQVLAEMESLVAQSRYTDAMEAARRADPSRADVAYTKVQSLLEEVETKVYGATRAERDYARRRAEELLLRIDRREASPEALLAQLDDLIRTQSRLINDASLARLRTRRSDVEEWVKQARTDRIPEEWTDVEATVKTLEGQHRFQGAIDAYLTFLTEKREYMSEDQFVAYRNKADAEKERLMMEASKAWRNADDYATNLNNRGEKARAIRVLRKVIENYGIDMYVEKAERSLKRIESD
jgi:hypothetical protein